MAAVLFVKVSRRLQPAALALLLAGAVQLATAAARPHAVTHVRAALAQSAPERS